MGLFDNLTTEGLEESKDVAGGGGYQPLPSDIYSAVIKLAYANKSRSSDAQSVTFHADINGNEYRETVWITSGKGVNYYVSKEDGKTRIPLPGFAIIDELCLLATKEPLSAQTTEEKVVKLYNYEEKKEVPTPVPVLTSLIGTQVKLGVLREIVDRTARDDSGNYVPTGETRTQNVVSKVFHAETNKTVNEYRHNVKNPEFYTTWLAQNQGKDRNRAKGASTTVAKGMSGTGRPQAAKLFD